MLKTRGKTKQSDKIKVALITRVCPHYVISSYQKLGQYVDLQVFYGRGQSLTSVKNASEISGFKHTLLTTLPLTFTIGDRNYYMPIHPSLIFHLLSGKYDIIITEGASNILNDLWIFLFCTLTKTPLVIRDAGRIPGSHRSLQRKILDVVFNAICRHADAVLVYGDLSREYMLSIGVADEKIFVAQNTFNTETAIQERMKIMGNTKILAEERQKLGLERKKVILYCGSLEERKKIPNLLKALKNIQLKGRQVALLIVGDGPLRKPLETQVATLGLNNVYFLGEILSDTAKYFMLSDILVLPGWNTLATVEAMFYGIPVITVRRGGPEFELVKDGETGFLVEVDNIPQLEEVMLKVLQDDHLREKVRKNARSYVSRFSLDNMVKKTVEAIEYAFRMKNTNSEMCL